MNFLTITGLITYLTPINITIYLLMINLIGILCMYIDKRKAKYGRWRIPEKTLIFIRVIRWFNWMYDWNVYFQT